MQCPTKEINAFYPANIANSICVTPLRTDVFKARQEAGKQAMIRGIFPSQVLFTDEIPHEFKSSRALFQIKETRNIMVFDIGGGTLDITIMTAKEGEFDVKGTIGDTHLGGQKYARNTS